MSVSSTTLLSAFAMILLPRIFSICHPHDVLFVPSPPPKGPVTGETDLNEATHPLCRKTVTPKRNKVHH